MKSTIPELELEDMLFQGTKITTVVCMGCMPWEELKSILTDERALGPNVNIITDQQLKESRDIEPYETNPSLSIVENDRNLISYIAALPAGMVALFSSGNLRHTAVNRLTVAKANFLLSQHSPTDHSLVSISAVEKGDCHEIYEKGQFVETTRTAGSR